jgi:FHA domain
MCLLGLVLGLALGKPAPAFAQGKTLTLDSVTLEPSRITGFSRLRAYISGMSLEGDSLDIKPGDVRLMVGGSALRAPYGVGRFGASDAELSVVIILEAAFEYAQVLPTIQEVVAEELLAKLPDRSRVAIVGYGESVQSGKLDTLKKARARLAALAPDLGPSEPALVEAIEGALGLFRRVRTVPPGRPTRKVIVLVSDGRDRLGDRDRVSSVGQRANREGVRILSLAYSPTNTRRPLLNLGEVAKQSRGTFRWLRTGEKQSWEVQMRRVREQIEEQVVLTYFVENGEEADRVSGKRATAQLSIGSGEITSNELKIPEAGCSKDVCIPGQWCLAGTCVMEREQTGRGFVGWLVLLLGIGAGALTVLGGVGYVVSKRAARPMPPPGVFPPGHPGSVPPGAGVPGGPGIPGVPGIPPTGAYPPGSHPPQAGSVPPPMHAPPQPVAGGPQLYIASGPRQGQRIPLFHGFSIGKAPNCSLVIDDGFASTNHAQLSVDSRGFCTIYDRGSTNGTFVNGVRITEMPLEHGAALRIGATELRFLAE